MAPFEEKLEQACQAHDLPNAVLISSNKNGM